MSAAGEASNLEWDAEGELTAVDGESFIYDASGNRIVRFGAAGVTVYLPGGQEITIDGVSLAATRYYSFAGKTVAMRTSRGLGGVTSLVADHQGTTVAAVPNTSWGASSVQRVYADPFGNKRDGSGSAPGDRAFLGAVEDITGLSLLGARYYDASVGSFISVDPLLSPGVAAQFNAYVYSGNNPITWSDPSGLFWGDLWKGVQSAAKKVGSVATSAWNATTSFVNKYKAEIVGAVVGIAVTAGCLAVTAGAGSIACAVAGGAAAGAVTNVMKQTESGRPFDAGSFARDTLIGGAAGFLGGAAGPVLGAAVRGVTSTGAGAAAIAATRSSVQTALSRAPSFRPSAAPVRPTAMAGGGSKPAGMSSVGSSCRTNSFVPGTLVLMGDGHTKPIQDVRLGDTVLAADPATGEFGSRPVVALIEGTGVKELVTVTTERGSVVATAGHPFWSESDATWVDAGDLAVGDAVLEADGGTSVVVALSEVMQPATVHNLTVADLHTYFVVVGDATVLVHNCGGVVRPEKKTVAIGEGMDDRVIPFAKNNNADWYSPDPAAPPSRWMDNNRQWINDRMDEGCRILDCGPAPGRSNFPGATSPYYQMELDEIFKRGYGNVQVNID